MDFSSMVTEAMKILLPYVTLGATEFVHTVGEIGFQKAKVLFEKLKVRWSGDTEASSALQNFEEKPERYRVIVEDILREKLSEDSDFAREIADTLNDLKPVIEIVQEVAEGKEVTGLESDEMHAGQATITQKITKAETATGAKIKRVG